MRGSGTGEYFCQGNISAGNSSRALFGINELHLDIIPALYIPDGETDKSENKEYGHVVAQNNRMLG